MMLICHFCQNGQSCQETISKPNTYTNLRDHLPVTKDKGTQEIKIKRFIERATYYLDYEYYIILLAQMYNMVILSRHPQFGAQLRHCSS